MKIRAWLSAFAILLAPLTAFAFVPESGFYQQFTPDNGSSGGGTGIAIEIQNQYMFAAGYVYTATGVPTFVTMQGLLLLQSDGSWNLSTSPSDPGNGLAAYSGGQCIGTTANCPYHAPAATKIGDFNIQFIGENIATLTWGTTANQANTILRRFHFYTGPSEATSLLGQWDVVISRGVSADVLDYEGDKLVLYSASTPDSSGNSMLLGCVPSNAGTPTCTGRSIATNVTPCTGLFCFGSSHYDAIVSNGSGATPIVRVYSFDSNVFAGEFTQSFHGTVHLCPSGAASVSACNISMAHFIAYRSGSAQYAQSGVGMSQP